MAVGSDPQVSEDLFTKIALENKLVTKYQLRKASEEQQKLEGDGEDVDLGQVLIRLGFLSERQHQSVMNACSYRSQRDYDKRFGRQCMRMELLDQGRIEAALSTQKAEYMKTGSVRPLSEILEEEGALDEDELGQVHEGIRARDKARAAARSGKNPALAVSTTTPVARKQSEDEDDDDADLDDADLDEDEDDDDADLDDADLDDADLDDADLDDADLDDVDLDDADLDDDDLDDVDIDDLDDEGPEAEEATSKSASAIDIDLEGVDLDDDDGDDEDLDDVAEVVSEVDSDVRLDDDDLRDLQQLGSADEQAEEAAWTADAFDDRPLDKRPPSERNVLPDPQPLPASGTTEPAAPPQVPRAAGSSRLKRPLAEEETAADEAGTIVADVPPDIGEIDRDEGAFPGSDVFEAGVSDIGQIADLDDDDDEDAPGGLAAGRQVASTASDLSPVLDDVIDEPQAPEPQAPKPVEPEPAGGPRDSEVHFGPRALARMAAQAAQAAQEAKRGSPPPAAASAALPHDWRDDPRLRMAFEKALQAAWDVFVQELDRGES